MQWYTAIRAGQIRSNASKTLKTANSADRFSPRVSIRRRPADLRSEESSDRKPEALVRDAQSPAEHRYDLGQPDWPGFLDN